MYDTQRRLVEVFTSFAQNNEDVMLWRALKSVERGFYIDIGANDPVEDSVTKAFYDRGWHGINIEPLSTHLVDLATQRPRDINLQCAAGSEHGVIDLWEPEVRGWATADVATARLHANAGIKGKHHSVAIRTLASICEEHCTGDIHFLKVDVEGFEESVLRGANFDKFRPWVVVVEATKPNSSIEIHSQWEHLLLEGRYLFAYADGLNRFYVAREHRELLAAFAYPPNVFDNYVTFHQQQSQESVNKLQANLDTALTTANEQAQVLHRICTSVSWKIMSPLWWCESRIVRYFQNRKRILNDALQISQIPLDAVVNRASLLDESGNVISAAEVGQAVVLQAQVAAKVALDPLRVGYEVKNQQGQVVYSTHTADSHQSLSNVNAGSEHVFEISFNTKLPAGEYMVKTILSSPETHRIINYESRHSHLPFTIVSAPQSRFVGSDKLVPTTK